VLPKTNKNLMRNSTENKTNAGNDIVYKEKQIKKLKKKPESAGRGSGTGRTYGDKNTYTQFVLELDGLRTFIVFYSRVKLKTKNHLKTNSELVHIMKL